MTPDFWYGWLLGCFVTMGWLIPLNAWHVRALRKIDDDYVKALKESNEQYVASIKKIYKIPT